MKDENMKKTKTEVCFSCKHKTMVVHYRKKHNTNEWKVGHGECTNCGTRFIV